MMDKDLKDTVWKISLIVLLIGAMVFAFVRYDAEIEKLRKDVTALQLPRGEQAQAQKRALKAIESAKKLIVDKYEETQENTYADGINFKTAATEHTGYVPNGTQEAGGGLGEKLDSIVSRGGNLTKLPGKAIYRAGQTLQSVQFGGLGGIAEYGKGVKSLAGQAGNVKKRFAEYRSRHDGDLEAIADDDSGDDHKMSLGGVAQKVGSETYKKIADKTSKILWEKKLSSVYKKLSGNIDPNVAANRTIDDIERAGLPLVVASKKIDSYLRFIADIESTHKIGVSIEDVFSTVFDVLEDCGNIEDKISAQDYLKHFVDDVRNRNQHSETPSRYALLCPAFFYSTGI